MTLIILNWFNNFLLGQKQQQQSRGGGLSSNSQIPHHDLMVLGELETFLSRSLSHHRSSENTIDWPAVRAEYTSHPDRPELMRRFVASLLDERARSCPSPINKQQPKPTASTTNNNEEEKLKAVDDFVDSVINRKRQRESERSLRLLESLLEKLVERRPRGDEVSVTEAEIRNLEAFVQNLRATHPSRQPAGNKIIIRTTRKLPAKVYITGKTSSF